MPGQRLIIMKINCDTSISAPGISKDLLVCNGKSVSLPKEGPMCSPRKGADCVEPRESAVNSDAIRRYGSVRLALIQTEETI